MSPHERRRRSNAALYERSRAIAHTLQPSLLPAELPSIDGLEIAARYAAAGEGMDVGGDFYDFFALESGRGWAAVLDDVCGKGAEAAALTAPARHTVRAQQYLEPGAVLARLNTAVVRQGDDLRFLTACYVWLERPDDGVRAVVARGGHPPLLIVRGTGAVEALTPRGPLIGIAESARFEPAEVTPADGDSLVLYTDGTTEARSPSGEFYGGRRLETVLSSLSDRSAQDIAQGIIDDVSRFQPGAARDDIAILVVRVGPETGIARMAGATTPRSVAAG